MEVILAMLQADAWSLGSFFEQIKAWEIVILVLGFILLIVEMFVPGFGIAGGIGIALLILGIILTAQTPLQALVMFGILVVLVAIVLWIILRSAKKGKLARSLILRSSSTREAGYSASRDMSDQVGRTGVASTYLRPAGIGEFEGRRLDVVSEGEFIEKGMCIRITKVFGSRIVVEKCEDSSKVQK